MNSSESISSSVASGRADQLQFLRFLAFLNVFIAHAEVWNFFGYPASHCATFAVSFFFSLSGLVTGYSYYGREVKPTLWNIGKDMWKKVRKIYPLYILTMLFPILYSDVPAMVTNQDFAALTETVVDFFANLLFIKSWLPGGIPSFNGLDWFLATIMPLYLLNLPVTYLLNKINKNKYRYLIFGTAFCGLFFLTAVYCYLTQGLNMAYWHYKFPPARMGEYLSGMILGFAIRAFADRVPEGKLTRIGFTVLEVAAMAFWAFSLRRAGNYWMNHIVAWLVPNAFLLAVFTFGRGWFSQLFRAKPLVWLGDISFECYLLHHLIVRRYAVLNVVEPVARFEQIFSFFYCLILTVLIAGMFHRAPKKKQA